MVGKMNKRARAFSLVVEDVRHPQTTTRPVSAPQTPAQAATADFAVALGPIPAVLPCGSRD